MKRIKINSISQAIRIRSLKKTATYASCSTTFKEFMFTAVSIMGNSELELEVCGNTISIPIPSHSHWLIPIPFPIPVY